MATAQEPPHSAELDAAIIRAAKRHGVPEHLVRRIVMRESRYNPRARNHSFWGLMQISYPDRAQHGLQGHARATAEPGHQSRLRRPPISPTPSSSPAGRRTRRCASTPAAITPTAKNRGVLGLLRTADSKPLNGVPDEPIAGPAAVASADSGGWSLFGSSAPAPEPAAPAPQQLAYAAASDGAAAAPAQAQIAAVAHAAPGHASKSAAKVADKNGDDGVAMVEGRGGAMAPPKRWQRDGGTSVIARGEQGLEHVAAYRLGDQAVASARRSRKTAVFAQLDAGASAAPTASDAQPQSTAFFATRRAAARDRPPPSRRSRRRRRSPPTRPPARPSRQQSPDAGSKSKHRHHRRRSSDD